jgi:hypothetical protein
MLFIYTDKVQKTRSVVNLNLNYTQCYQKICPADEQASYWFEAASQACQFVNENNLTSGPKNSPVFEVVNNTNTNEKSFAGSQVTVSSVLGFIGLALAFL